MFLNYNHEIKKMQLDEHIENWEQAKVQKWFSEHSTMERWYQQNFFNHENTPFEEHMTVWKCQQFHTVQEFQTTTLAHTSYVHIFLTPLKQVAYV